MHSFFFEIHGGKHKKSVSFRFAICYGDASSMRSTIPNVDEKMRAMLKQYASTDIEDVEFEEIDLEEKELFPNRENTE